MATAPLQSLYAGTPEEKEALEEVKSSQRMLNDALMYRVNMLDPTMLAMAQGFLAPTDRKSTRLNSSHSQQSRMPSSA